MKIVKKKQQLNMDCSFYLSIIWLFKLQTIMCFRNFSMFEKLFHVSETFPGVKNLSMLEQMFHI